MKPFRLWTIKEDLKTELDKMNIEQVPLWDEEINKVIRENPWIKEIVNKLNNEAPLVKVHEVWYSVPKSKEAIVEDIMKDIETWPINEYQKTALKDPEYMKYKAQA